MNIVRSIRITLTLLALVTTACSGAPEGIFILAPDDEPISLVADSGTQDTAGLAPPTPACGVPTAPGARCCLGVQPCLPGYTCVGAYPTWQCVP